MNGHTDRQTDSNVSESIRFVGKAASGLERI